MSRWEALLLILILSALILIWAPWAQYAPQIVRPSYAAELGFYPQSSQELQALLDALLAQPAQQLEGKLVALLVPHAGYRFSGMVAGSGYKLLEGSKFSRVFVIGSSHNFRYDFVALTNATHYRTPLGLVKISQLIQQLRAEPGFREFPQADWIEHSLEVQIPFLQRMLGEFELIPILAGQVDPFMLARKLIEYYDEDTLFVFTTDLSHYHPYHRALELDAICLQAISELDLAKLAECELCGRVPTAAAVIMARMMGLKPMLLSYMNSGDVTGDRSRVVGYAAFGFYWPWITQEQQQFLLELARDSIQHYMFNRTIPQFRNPHPDLELTRASFVTLTIDGKLRGCMGHSFPMLPLYRDVIISAINAGFQDPRFPGLSPAELNRIEIEISVLSFPGLIRENPQNHPKRIQVGKHGLILIKGERSGLLLPSVPVEQGWDSREFLDQLCLKAGLARKCWLEKDAKIYRFWAQSFSETHR